MRLLVTPTAVALLLLGCGSAAGAAASSVPAASPPAASPAATAAAVDVTVQPRQLGAVVGGRFTVQSRITNIGAVDTGPLIAHLNVASLTSNVYVDPEDWSSDRSEQLDPLEPGEDDTVTWQLQAVNVGSFDVYIVTLPADSGGQLAVSPAVRVTVAGRPTLNAGGVLPVALVVPLLLGLAAGAARLRTRRAAR